jgi:hypothetical protein
MPQIEHENAADFLNCLGVLVCGVARGNDKLGLGALHVGTPIGHDTVGGIGSVASAPVAHDGQDPASVLTYCWKSGVFGTRCNGGGAIIPAAVIGNWMLERAELLLA